MTIKLVSLANDGSHPDDGGSIVASTLSPNGRYVAWLSSSKQLVDEETPDPGFLNAGYWYIRDLQENTTLRVTSEGSAKAFHIFSSQSFVINDAGAGAWSTNNQVGGVYDAEGNSTRLLATSNSSLDRRHTPLTDGSGLLELGEVGTVEYFDGYSHGDVFAFSFFDASGKPTSSFSVNDEVLPSFKEGQSLVNFEDRPFLAGPSANPDFALLTYTLSLEGSTPRVGGNGSMDHVGGYLSTDLAVVDLKTGEIDRVLSHQKNSIETVLDNPTDFVSGEGNANRIFFDPIHTDFDVSHTSDLTANGRYVVFETSAAEYGGDSGRDIVKFDRTTRSITHVSQIDGKSSDKDVRFPSISDDGRFVTFWAEEEGFGGTTSPWNIMVWDSTVDELKAVNANLSGGTSFASKRAPEISADGTKIIFASTVGDFVEGDENERSDIFIADNPFLATGPDPINGTSGNDRMMGGAGDDSMSGFDGADTLIGDAGNDTLTGGVSANDLRDVIFGGAGNDLIDGGYGNDELRGDAGNDTIIGGFGADTVIGGAGDDVLTASALGDVMFGGDGDDFINGGFGYDRVNGGAGADEFYHLGVANHASDWIQDYDAAQGDVLVFGRAGATRGQFQVNIATTPKAGTGGVEEAFVIYRPTGQIMWALVDGDGQDEINLRIGGDVFDLMG